MVWIALLLALFGIALVATGRRGRRINDHPVCRRCRFDLVGVYPGVERCPECGAELATTGAVRTGARRARRRDIITGVVFLAGAAMVLGFAALVGVTGTNWNKYMPTAWLVYRAEQGRPGAVADVLAELEVRAGADELRADQIAALVERTLAVQADLSVAWDVAWGDLFDAMHAAGHVGAEDYATYMRQAVSVQGTVRRRVRAQAGRELPLWAEVSIGRGGSWTMMFVQVEPVEIEIAGERVRPRGNVVGWASLSGPQASAGRGISVLVEEEPGTYEMRAVWKVRVVESLNEEAAEIAAVEHVLEATVEIVPEDVQVVEVVRDAGMAEAFRAGCDVHELWARRLTNGKALASVGIRSNERPTGIAMEVWLVADGREWLVNEFTFPAGSGGWSTSVGGEIEGFDGEVVRVEFRPSVGAAEGAVEMEAMLGETVVYEGVSVEWRE